MVKRLTASLLAVALISLLVSGATFALFTATTSNVNNTFSSGTVSLGNPTSTSIVVSNIAPGDTGSNSFSVDYTGSLEAWLALDTDIDAVDPVTVTDLFDGPTPLSVTITDNITPGKTYNLDGTNQVVGKFGGSGNPASVTLNVVYELPLGAGNDYQDKTGTLTLTVHAVQAKNNTNAAETGPNSWN